MATDPDIEQALKFAQELSDKIFKAQEKLDKSFEAELSKQIPQAIQENDDVIIKLRLQELQKAIHGMEENLEDTLRAVNYIEQMNGDDEFSSAHHDEIQSVTTIVAHTRAKLTRQIESAKKLEITAKKGVESAAGSKEVAEREFDEIEVRINDEKKYLPGTVKKAQDASDKAQQAVDARDAKALADAQKSVKDLAIDALVMYHETQDFENRINSFLKKPQIQALDADLQTQFKDGSKKLLGTNQENAKDLERLQALSKSVGELALGVFEVKKVMKTLQIDPKIQAKVEPVLAKILKGPGKDLEKGLEGVAKQFKLSTTGKQMATALKKAGDSVYK